MYNLAAVRVALLKLGLEDWIPLPEAVQTVLGRGSLDPEQEVRETLRELGGEGLIRFWRGPWDKDDEHAEVPTQEALLLLQDPRWYRFRLDEPNEERLYFVNVDNIAPSSG